MTQESAKNFQIEFKGKQVCMTCCSNLFKNIFLIHAV